MKKHFLKLIVFLVLQCTLVLVAWGDAVGPNIGISDCDTSFLDKEPSLSWANDPFLKKPGFGIKETDPSDFKLEAVIWDNTSPRAIVNGVGLRKGDYFMRKRVSKIGENYIVLEEEDSMVELTLPLRTPASKLESVISIEEVKK